MYNFMIFKRVDGEEPNFFNIGDDGQLNISHHVISHEEAEGLLKIPHETGEPETLSGQGIKIFCEKRFKPSEKERALLILKYLEKQ